jgi:hypothetical protein
MRWSSHSAARFFASRSEAESGEGARALAVREPRRDQRMCDLPKVLAASDTIWLLRKFADVGKKPSSERHTDVLRKPNGFFNLP